MIPYIIKAALILAGCLAFYKVLLRRETFYRMNRYVLIICLLISFTLPLLHMPQQFSLRKSKQEATLVPSAPLISQAKETKTTPVQEVKSLPAKDPVTTVKDKPASQPTVVSSTPLISWDRALNWMFWIYWTGVLIFAFSFLFQVIVLLWRIRIHPMIKDGRYTIIEMPGDKAPCSFGSYIFINPSKYDWETYNQIIQHEKIHIRQNHSLDILFAELVLIFQWFNPFAWFYRREVENNLEFLTDDQLMQEKMDKTSYQLSLLKVSAPHFPLSLTTNYNQSILKKRIAMMNAKKSSMHTAWKYLFLLPVLALLASILNEPRAQRGGGPFPNATVEKRNTMETEGYWFAVIKDDQVKIMFSDEEIKDDKEDFKGHHSFSSTTFKLSELSSIPKGESGTFNITREAGRMDFTGKFDGNTGMGKYKFVADKGYADQMNRELNDKLDEDDQLAFFFINVKRDYVAMLKQEGYTKLDKDDVIPLAALGVDQAFIRSMKNSFKDVDADKLVTLKALNIDEKYIKDIRSTGIKDLDADQIVSFKAQNIDKEYIEKVRKVKGNNKDGDDADDIVSFKAMNITDDYISSLKSVGLTDLSKQDLVSMKAVGVTAEYVKSIQSVGLKDFDADELVGMKAVGVTADYVKSVRDMGFTEVKGENLTAMKAQDITPEFINGFKAIGYTKLDLDEVISMKALGITPDFVKGFEAIGYKNIPVDELTGLKAMNVTPAYITEMKSKGFVYEKLQKYITLKSIAD